MLRCLGLTICLLVVTMSYPPGTPAWIPIFNAFLFGSGAVLCALWLVAPGRGGAAR